MASLRQVTDRPTSVRLGRSAGRRDRTQHDAPARPRSCHRAIQLPPGIKTPATRSQPAAAEYEAVCLCSHIDLVVCLAPSAYTLFTAQANPERRLS